MLELACEFPCGHVHFTEGNQQVKQQIGCLADEFLAAAPNARYRGLHTFLADFLHYALATLTEELRRIGTLGAFRFALSYELFQLRNDRTERVRRYRFVACNRLKET